MRKALIAAAALLIQCVVATAQAPDKLAGRWAGTVEGIQGKQNAVATSGLNPESLTMIRTRFILDWFNEYAANYPTKLFELQRQLLQEGLFEAYNQWIFGIAQNLAVYQNWTNTHSEEFNEFSRFQKGRIYKVPAGQYYHTEPERKGK